MAWQSEKSEEVLLLYTTKITNWQYGEIVMVKGFDLQSSCLHSFTFSPVHSALIESSQYVKI